MKFLILIILLLATPALAEDPCAGRNPRFCTPSPEPLICGYERVKPKGSMATAHDYVCRSGDRVVFVRQGQSNNYSISDVKERNYGR